MKAIVLRELGGPEKLLYEEVPDPQAGPGEVVVKLKAAALNHRDQWIRYGQYAGSSCRSSSARTRRRSAGGLAQA